MNSPDGISVRNGRDLAANILNHPWGGLAALLNFAENQENEWIEYKAALSPRNGVPEPGANSEDYVWHVARAVISLANWAGGAVIIGIDNQGKAVGLEASDARGILAQQGREAFNLKVLMPAITGPRWKTGRSGNFQVEVKLEQLVEVCNATYQGLPVAVILVTPASGQECIEVCQVYQNQNHTRYLTLVRARGAQGRVLELQSRMDLHTHYDVRRQQLQSPVWQQRWEQFLLDADPPPEMRVHSVTEAGIGQAVDLTIDAAVEQALVDYCRSVNSQLAQLQDRFTPLLAEAGEPTMAVPHVEPEAEAVADLFISDSPYGSRPAASETGRLYRNEAAFGDKNVPKGPVPRQRGNLLDQLAQAPRALLLGEPGAGKSTCLKRLTLEGAAMYATGGILPLYVPLRRFTRAGLPDLLAQAARQPWEVLASLIRQQRLRLLLDAVNECPRHLQTRCCQKISALMADFPKLPLILSSRVTTWPCRINLPVLILCPLNPNQQQYFLTACLGSAEKAGALLARLHKLPGGARMAGSPIFLRMVEQISRRHEDLPRGQALLYRRLLDDWFTREQNKESSTGATLRWSYAVTLEALGRLAFEARKAGLVSLPLNQALQILRPLLLEDSRHFVERMAQGLLLNQEADGEVLSFIHESIQEYLAAEYLIRCPEALETLLNTQDDNWRMPLVYRSELLQQTA